MKEQLDFWYKKAVENEKIKDKLSIVEYMEPYVWIYNLLYNKLQENIKN